MMMLSALLVATCLLGLASAQDLTCSELNAGGNDPFSGENEIPASLDT